MLFWQPIMQGRRQQQRLVHIRRPKALSHGRILTAYTLWKSCYVWYFCRIYSRQTPRADIRRWGPCFQLRLRQDDELWLAAAAHVVDRAGIEGAGIVLVAAGSIRLHGDLLVRAADDGIVGLKRIVGAE